MISQEDIQRAKGLCERAHKGPWFQSRLHGDWVLTEAEGVGRVIAQEVLSFGDMEFITESRTLLPAFIEEITRLNKVVEQAIKKAGIELLDRWIANTSTLDDPSDYPELAQHLAQGEKE